MQNILITGGAGFIGSNFVRHILDKHPEYRVVNYDLLTYAGNLENLKDINNKNYSFVKGDVCDFRLLEETITKFRIGTIVHFAAESHVDRSIENPDIFVKTNVIGTQTLLNLTKKHNLRFHHISTDEVYGSLKNEDPKFNEKNSYKPNSPYSASKAASDHLVNAYHHTFNLKTTISNCSNNYGPYQFPEKLIPLFITNLIENKKIGVYGTGLNIRDWLHVLDHCNAIDLILHKGEIGETYCIGGDCEKTNIEITRIILKKMDCGESMINYVEDRKGHDFRYAINCSKIKKELGWTQKYEFEQGIKETIEWYKENVSWWRPLKLRLKQ